MATFCVGDIVTLHPEGKPDRQYTYRIVGHDKQGAPIAEVWAIGRYGMRNPLPYPREGVVLVDHVRGGPSVVKPW